MAKISSIDEALLMLSEGLTSAARNPNIKHYKPHAKQYTFHSSKKKKKLYIGGNRSGKTTGGVCEAIWRATCTHPYRADLNDIGPNRGRVVGVSLIDGIEGIILPQYKQWLYPSALRGGAWETAYDKALRTLNFSNGSTIEFKSYDQDLEKHAGTSRHWIHFDEEPPKSVYIENMARIIDTDGDFWITMTPVEGMTWVHDDLYQPNIEGEKDDVEIIEIDMTENPYLSKAAIQSFIDSIDEDERTARIGGKFVTVGGRIYKNFDPTVGGLHVHKEKIDNPKQQFKDWLWICSLDHGLNNPTAVLWSAVNVRGEIVTFHEHYKKDWTVDKHAAEINRINKLFGRKPDLYVADPSIQNRNPITGTSIHQEYIKHGIPFTLGNNDVEAGLIRVRRYINPSADNNGRPLWTCTPNCSNLIWEAKKYRWKTYVNKKQQYENNAYETPHKKDDHAMDALRYMIMTRPDLSAEKQNDFAENVREALDNFNFSVPASVITGPHADPNALEQNPNWSERNSIPNNYGGDEWAYDEHMGAFW